MIGALTNHLWQSTAFAVAVGLLTRAFRNHQAQVRYGLWLTASLKFLLPFTLLVSLTTRFDWASSARTIAAPAVSSAMAQITTPFAETWLPAPAPTPTAPPGTDWRLALLAAWTCGFAAIGLLRLRTWRRIRAAVRASTAFEAPALDVPGGVDVRSAPGLLEPGVVGWWRPILLIPADIEAHLTPLQLGAVLAHERCHVRRRDNLTAAIHMVVEAIFWFHPLVWWIGARMVEERERACDEDVLRTVGEPQAYAEGILNVCKRYVEAPLACVSGVGGSNLRTRIEAIMDNRIGMRLTFARRLALLSAIVAAIVVPVAVGTIAAPQNTAPLPRFDVASVKLCDNDSVPGGRGGGPTRFSPDGMTIDCQVIRGLIQQSYLVHAGGRDVSPDSGEVLRTPVEGGPDWISSDRYRITAKTEKTVRPGMLMGPMLQALLEDRFNLKLRREVREVPVYNLTIAKGGPKLTRFVEGNCVQTARVFPPAPPPDLLPGQKRCTSFTSARGADLSSTMEGITLDDYSKVMLFLASGRPVINRTGLTGKFTIHLEYAMNDEMRRIVGAQQGDPGEATTPSVFTAVQEQLGLKLEPAMGPGEALVIDHIERPSEN